MTFFCFTDAIMIYPIFVHSVQNCLRHGVVFCSFFCLKWVLWITFKLIDNEWIESTWRSQIPCIPPVFSCSPSYGTDGTSHRFGKQTLLPDDEHWEMQIPQLDAFWRICVLPETRKDGLKIYTWSQKSPIIFCWLDYWLIFNNLHDLVKSINIIIIIIIIKNL